jgi:hypothetical protein
VPLLAHFFVNKYNGLKAIEEGPDTFGNYST